MFGAIKLEPLRLSKRQHLADLGNERWNLGRYKGHANEGTGMIIKRKEIEQA